MKVLIVAMLFFSTILCSAKEPKFMKGERVTYKVPKFYQLVCTGKGRVDRYDDRNNTYSIEESVDRSPDCPTMDNIQEKDIQAVK